MTTTPDIQLEFTGLAVAAGDAARALRAYAAAERRQVLTILMTAVSEVLDDDGKSAPTTRQLAEHVVCERVGYDSPAYRETADMLELLRSRGALLSFPGEPGYFARDDDPAEVTRWIRTPAAREAGR